jgi:hypothetical protein
MAAMAGDATPTPGALLRAWLDRALDAEGRQWLDDALRRARGSDRDLFLAVSLVARRLGKADLALSAGDLAAAGAARPGWDPTGLSVDQAARILLVLEAGGDGDAFASRLRTLFATADLAETIAFLRGLPLYPDPERHLHRAREGARSNMRPVFEAVAHRNPYPREVFDENAWNQMVLKALFVGSPLHPIQGLEARANAELARILRDYAHERWAAGRTVTPELWRCVGRFADPETLADLERVLATGTPVEREGVALALRDCPRAEARAILGRAPDLAAAIAAGRLDWDALGARL